MLLTRLFCEPNDLLPLIVKILPLEDVLNFRLCNKNIKQYCNIRLQIKDKFFSNLKNYNSDLLLSVSFDAIQFGSQKNELIDLIRSTKVLALSIWGDGDTSICDSGVVDICNAVRSSLQKLDLSEDYPLRFGDIGVEKIGNLLKTNTSIRSISLDGDIKDFGVASICESLKINNSLTDLHLACNDIQNYGAESLRGAISLNSSLTKLALRLRSSNVDSERPELNVIWGALKFNSTISVLSLDYSTGIRECNGLRLAQALRYNSTLTELFMSDCHIGPLAAEAMAEMLKENDSLIYLGLDSNDIEDLGTKHICEAIEINTKLTHLFLRMNRMGVESAARLSDAIRHTSTLVSLDLSYNEGLTENGVILIADALMTNSSLKRISLEGSYSTTPADAALRNVSKLKPHLSIDFSDHLRDFDNEDDEDANRLDLANESDDG